MGRSPIFDRTIYIKANPRKVWKSIVSPAIVNKYYLCPLVKLESKQGGTIIYGSKDNPVILGKVKVFKPNKTFAHTFKFAHRKKDPSTIVTYELSKCGANNTALTLVHKGFRGKNGTFRDISGGWDMILSNLKSLIETGKPIKW